MLVGIGNRKSEIVVETLLWEDFLRGFLSEKVSNYRKVGNLGVYKKSELMVVESGDISISSVKAGFLPGLASYL